MNSAPNFLVEWSSPWHEFWTSIRPALSRSPEPLSGEAPVGIFPYRGTLVAWAFEIAFVVAMIALSQHLAEMRALEPAVMIKPEVIYFTGNELPRTEDTGGTRAGRSGRGGGRQAHHPTQTIRVARGETLRERVVDAPRLNLPHSEAAVANLLAYKPIPGPAPTEGLKSSQRAPQMQMQAVAPAPQVQAEKMRSALTLNASVVPPAPAAPQRDLTAQHIPGNQPMQVIPPAVSAPERLSSQNARLTLPAPAVVAPPPQITREKVTPGPGFGAGQPTQVIPPPAQVANNATDRRSFGGLGTNTSVVPPTVQMDNGSMQRHPSNDLGGRAAVVPPTVELSGGASQRHAGLNGSAAVVPPAPTLSGGSSEARGNRGTGLGGPAGAGVLAPPKDAGGSTPGTGVVVSSQPGSAKGVPANSAAGALALSPSGGSTPGLGGAGGGSSIGRGADTGSGLTGKDIGAGKSDNGRGSDTMAHSGISPYPGTGGAGNGTTSKPAMPGVSVSGGSTGIVNLPSFASSGSQPSNQGKSTTAKDERPSITVVASSRSGGAFNFYGTLKGDKVYTIYIDTNLGPAVMEFADPNSVGHGGEDLTAPRPMRASVNAPAGMKRSRLVIACVLDRTGIVKNAHVLEPGTTEMTTKVMASLSSWKFSPALRGNQPVEVNAILGFDIDTR